MASTGIAQKYADQVKKGQEYINSQSQENTQTGSVPYGSSLTEAVENLRKAEEAAAARGNQEYIEVVSKRREQEAAEAAAKGETYTPDNTILSNSILTPTIAGAPERTKNGVQDSVSEKYKEDVGLSEDSHIYKQAAQVNGEIQAGGEATNLKRQNKEFKLDKQAWADTEGTTGSKRNEVAEDGAYHWEGHYDENGNWVSGVTEWVQDDQARLQANINDYKNTVDNELFLTEEEVQAKQQECANIHYDVGELVEYTQAVVDEFKAKYDQTYASASDEEKKELDEKLADYNNELEVYKSWQDTSKEMYDLWSGLNDLYSTADDNKMADVADPKYYQEDQYGGNTPEIIQIQIDNLDVYIKGKKAELNEKTASGQYAPSELDPLRAEIKDKETQSTNLQKDLELANARKAQLEQDNSEFDLKRKYIFTNSTEKWQNAYVKLNTALAEAQAAGDEAKAAQINREIQYVLKNEEVSTKKGIYDEYMAQENGKYVVSDDALNKAIAELSPGAEKPLINTQPTVLTRSADEIQAEMAKLDPVKDWEKYEALRKEYAAVTTGKQIDDAIESVTEQKPLTDAEQWKLDALLDIKEMREMEAYFQNNYKDDDRAEAARKWKEDAEDKYDKAMAAFVEAKEPTNRHGAAPAIDLYNQLFKRDENNAAISAAQAQLEAATKELDYATANYMLYAAADKNLKADAAKGAEKAPSLKNLQDAFTTVKKPRLELDNKKDLGVLAGLGFTGEEAHELLKVLNTLGTSAMDFLPRTAQTTAGEKATHLDAHGKTARNWTQLELDTYYAIYEREGAVSATKYAARVNSLIGSEYHNQIQQNMLDAKMYEAQHGKGAFLGEALISPWVTNLLNITALGDFAATTSQVGTLGFDVQGVNFTPYELANMVNEVTTNVVTSTAKHPELASFLYNSYNSAVGSVESAGAGSALGAGVSSALKLGSEAVIFGDSVAQAIARGYTGLSFFGSAAMSSYEQFKQSGVDPTRAWQAALASGLFESFFEDMSFDKIYDAINGGRIFTGFLDFAGNLAVGAGIEASEEVLTEAANNLSERILLGKDSPFWVSVNNYHDSMGMSYVEAYKKALMDEGKDVALAAASAILSTLGSQGVPSALHYAPYAKSTNAQAKVYGQKINGGSEDVQDLGKKLGEFYSKYEFTKDGQAIKVPSGQQGNLERLHALAEKAKNGNASEKEIGQLVMLAKAMDAKTFYSFVGDNLSAWAQVSIGDIGAAADIALGAVIGDKNVFPFRIAQNQNPDAVVEDTFVTGLRKADSSLSHDDALKIESFLSGILTGSKTMTEEQLRDLIGRIFQNEATRNYIKGYIQEKVQQYQETGMTDFSWAAVVSPDLITDDFTKMMVNIWSGIQRVEESQAVYNAALAEAMEEQFIHDVETGKSENRFAKGLAANRSDMDAVIIGDRVITRKDFVATAVNEGKNLFTGEKFDTGNGGITENQAQAFFDGRIFAYAGVDSSKGIAYAEKFNLRTGEALTEEQIARGRERFYRLVNGEAPQAGETQQQGYKLPDNAVPYKQPWLQSDESELEQKIAVLTNELVELTNNSRHLLSGEAREQREAQIKAKEAQLINYRRDLNILRGRRSSNGTLSSGTQERIGNADGRADAGAVSEGRVGSSEGTANDSTGARALPGGVQGVSGENVQSESGRVELPNGQFIEDGQVLYDSDSSENTDNLTSEEKAILEAAKKAGAERVVFVYSSAIKTPGGGTLAGYENQTNGKRTIVLNTNTDLRNGTHEVRHVSMERLQELSQAASKKAGYGLTVREAYTVAFVAEVFKGREGLLGQLVAYYAEKNKGAFKNRTEEEFYAYLCEEIFCDLTSPDGLDRMSMIDGVSVISQAEMKELHTLAMAYLNASGLQEYIDAGGKNKKGTPVSFAAFNNARAKAGQTTETKADTSKTQEAKKEEKKKPTIPSKKQTEEKQKAKEEAKVQEQKDREFFVFLQQQSENYDILPFLTGASTSTLQYIAGLTGTTDAEKTVIRAAKNELAKRQATDNTAEDTSEKEDQRGAHELSDEEILERISSLNKDVINNDSVPEDAKATAREAIQILQEEYDKRQKAKPVKPADIKTEENLRATDNKNPNTDKNGVSYIEKRKWTDTIQNPAKGDKETKTITRAKFVARAMSGDMNLLPNIGYYNPLTAAEANDLFDEIRADERSKKKDNKQGRNSVITEADEVEQQARYSVLDAEHNCWAPVFYSQMQRTIDEWTTNSGKEIPGKLGANQVVSWLKGKGVKKEEIKWSGIEQFLEGKKSVTRTELLQFMAENDLQIETKVSDPFSQYDRIRNLNPNISNIPEEGFDETYAVYSFLEENMPDIYEGYEVDGEYNKGVMSFYAVSEDGDEKIHLLDYVEDYGMTDYTDTARWANDHYNLFGGVNYREVLFSLPKSSYTNDSMKTHWGGNAEGIIAHARIDDMFTEYVPFSGKQGKVLFIEEIQSDWHNRLAKAGYSTAERDELADLMFYKEFNPSSMTEESRARYDELYGKLIAPLEEKANKLNEDTKEATDRIWEIVNELYDDIQNSYDWDDTIVKRWANSKGYNLKTDSPKMIFSSLMQDDDYSVVGLRDEGFLTDEEARFILDNRKAIIAAVNATKAVKTAKEGIQERIPDAPFAGSSDTYHEYVMKHLLRMAAEGDYDKIGWTNSQQQVDRWDKDYAKGYAIEYDQAIPKFMDKYCKQWGAKVDATTLENGETVWSVDITPQMKEDVLTNGQPRYSILEEGEFETAEDGQPAVTSSVPGLGLEGRYSKILETMPYGKQNIRVGDSSVTKTTRLSDNGELYLTTVRELRNEAFRKNPWLKETFGEKGMEKVIGEINSFMDRVGEEITKAGEEFHYLGLEDLANATLKLDPVTNTFNLTAMIPNGEYEINFDFGTICERRAALQQIVDSLLDRATYDDTGAASIKLDENTIMELNKALQREGINTQCLICFVETKRFNQAEGFIEFTTLWNNEVKKALKGKEAKRFDFEHGTEELSEERIQARREAIAHADFSGTKENAVKDFVQILAEYSPEDLQLLTLGDISSSTGRTNIIETFPEINTLIMKSGSSAPKPVYAFTPYNGEIESMTYTGKKYQSLKDYVKSLGGIRSQSFSDFIISHVFDHLQKTAGLAAMDLPAHTYTKVLARAVLFGMTGEKINTSILCGLTRNVGSWYSGLNQEVTDWNFNTEDHRDRPYLFADARAYKQGEAEYIQSFPWDEAVEYSLKEGYAGNVGPIVVGLSYWHNMLLQRDPLVAMVIAYHSSSMPKNVKQAMGVGRAADYTKVQNVLKLVTEDEIKVSKKTGKETITKHFGLYRPNYNIPEGVPSYATPPQSIGKKKGASAKYTAVSFDSFKDEKTRQRAWDIFHNGNIAEAFDDYLAEHGDMSESEAARAYMVDMLEFLNEQGLTLDTKKAETGHGKFDLYGDLEQTQDPYETSDNFIAYCLRNNEIPMFYEFLPDINYFKRVFDFTVFDPRSYNPKSGRYEKYAPQESVKLVNEDGELLLPHEKDEDAVDGFIRLMRQYMGKYNTEQEAVYNLLNSEDFMNEAWDIVEGRNSVLTPEEAAAQQAKKDAQLAVNGPKAVAHNNAQTETGSMLRTRGGFSPISRGGSLKGKGVPKGAKYRLGKVIGGSLYIHKNYLETAFEDDPRLEDDFNIAEELLREKYPDFEYNCIAYYPETHAIQFQAAPGFDTEREPAVGDMINVNAETGVVNEPKYVQQIWHHKWLWVDNDYTGFNVRNAWEWSRTFLNKLNEASIGGSINSWNKQLDRYGLPHDEPGEGRYSLVLVDPVRPSSDEWHRTLTQDEAQEEYHKKSGGANLWGATKEAQEESDRLIEEYQNSLKAREKEVGHKLEGKELEDFQEDYRNKKHPTQRGNTVATYSRIFNLVKLDNKEGFHGRILDASSGLGYGTALGREMFGDEVVDDIEPFPAPYYEPRLGRDYSKVFGTYDVIISSAVLNVCPQDQRDALVVKMGQMLNPDGKMYITTRAGKNDVDNLAKPPKDPKTKPNVQLGEHEFVESKHGAYQYGFTKGTRTIPDELQAYIQDVLGSDFKVETTDLNPSAIDPSILNPYSVTEKHPDPSPFSSYGNPAVIVTRIGNEGTENRWAKKNEESFNSDQIKDIGNKNPTHNPDMRYSVLTPEDNTYMDAVNSDDMETAQKIVDKAAKKAGYKKHAYHGTLAYGFNEFRMISTRELGVHFGTEEAARVFYNNTYKRHGYGDTPGIYDVYLKMENTLKTPDVWGDPEALDTIIRRVDSWVENGYNEHRQGAEDVRWTKADSKKLRDALKINDDYYAYRDACDAWWDETQRYEKTDEFVDPVTRKVYTEEEAWDLAEAEATKLGLTRSYRKNDDKTKYYASDSNHRHETLLFTLEPSYQGTPIQERIDAAAWKANQLAQTYLLNLGFDSIRYINEMEDIGSESYIILKPGNIKRADPVTYDDDGNIIPPSARFDDESKDIRYSVLNGVVTQDGKIYNHVIRVLYPYDREVMQDPDHFDNYVRQVFQGAYITTLDQNGEKQDIQFATDEKVIKHNFEHPGISELAYGRKTGRSSWLVYLNAKEIFDNSRFDRHEPQNPDWWNNHDWFDEGGWDKRTAYILDKNYTMYPVQLFIANTRDGRKIFYHAAVMTPAGVPIDVAATAANNPQENFRRRMQTLPKPAGYKSLDELEAERAEEQREADEAAIRGTEDRYSIIEDSAQYAGVEDEAIKHFGTTGSYRSAGYILEDGQMLDFSGLHWEGDLSPAEKQARRSYYDSRYVDHGDIFEAFEKISDNYPSDAGLAFMTRGNIRIVPETPGLEMSAYVEPTAKQYARIKDYIRTADRGAGGLDSGYFAIDFTTDRRRRPEVLKYEGRLNPDRIVNDIKSFYKTGEIPQPSVVSKFHNSVDEFGNGRLSVISDDEYLRAVESGDMETAQAMVDEAARAAGYDLLGYKGIRGQKQGDEYPFTIFKSRPGGIYLATDRAVADAFSKGYNFNTKRVTTGTVLTLYTKFNNPYILNLNEDNPPAWHQIPTPQDMKEFDPSMGDTTYTEEIGIVAKLMGYDGVIIRNVKEGSGYLTTDYVATSPEQIKLADPVTYYDDGSIIPLSERFDSESPDMRFSVLSPVDAFGDEVQVDDPNPTVTQSPLSDRLYYSSDGNTAYYKTTDGQTVVLNNVGTDSPEARYINYLEAMNNANSTDTTTTQPYTIPPKARNEADGYNLGESDAGLRRGSEEVSEAYQEGTLRRTGSLGERNGQSRSQSEEEESLGARYSILYDPEDDAFYNEYGEPIATPDMYPEGSIQRMLFDMARKGDTSFEELNKAIQKMVEDNGPFEESDYDALREIIENNPKYTEAQKQAAFKTMEKLIEKHGMHRYTDKDANKDVHFSKKNKKGKTIMKGVQTAARNAPEWLTIQDMRDALSNAAMSYTPMPNDEAIRRAKKIIDQRGYKNALEHFLTIAESGKQPSQVDVALGEILLKEAAAQGAAGDAIKLTANLTIMAHYTGQALQAFNILRKLTPDGQLYYLTKVVDDLNKRYEKRIDNPNKKQKKIEIDTALVEKLLASSTRAELDTVVEEIKQNIADQIPATFADKYNAWRYLAMLGNPKTHVRNMFGNLGFMPAVFIKDIIARRLEGIAYKSGKLEARNRIAHADLSWSSPYMKRAREDFKEMKDILTGKASGSGNKFSDANDIMEKRQIFDTKWLEKLRKANGGALEAEDLGFMWVYYTRAFAEGLQARGIKEDELNDFDTTPEGRKILNEVRAFAVNEAWRDTYHDANRLAQSLNNIKHNTGPLGYVLVEGVMPFTKTPANILKRGIEYSPIGLILSVMQLRRDLASGDYTTSECLDRMAAGITGTGLILLGAWLSHLGILRGAGPDDDEEDAFEKLQGHQSWAIELGGTSYTIDWMAPTALPLFTGSALDKMFDGEQGFGSFSEWVQLATKLLDPMMSLSMLDGLNNAFSSISNNRTTSALGALALQMGTGYITQAMPTFAGQIARSIDPYDRATFVEYGDKDAWVKRLLQSSFQSKIPGVVEAAERLIGKGDIDIPFTAENRMKRVDNWGRTEKADTVGDWIVKAFENFLSPGYISKINETPVDQEIARVYKATDGASKLPSKGGTYFSYSEDDQSMKKIMNADEYERFATARGQTAYDILDELFLTEEYNDATDIEKSVMIENAFDYANRYAEREVEPKKGLAKWMNTAEKIGVADYLTIKKELDENNSQEKLFAMMATETRLDSDQIATIMASKFTAPEYVDSPTEGFRYKLNDEDGDVLYSMNEELLKQGLETLRNDPRYINADEDGRKELLRELYSDTRTQTLANYGQILGRTDRVYTLKNAASIGKEAFTIALDQYDGDFAQQGHWLAGKYRADKTVDNPDHVGYEFEIPEYDKKNVLPQMFDKAYAEAYENMRRNNKEFIDAWNRGDKDYCSLMAADLYNQTADEVEAEYARQLAASGAKESFKEKPTGYTTYEAFKIAKERYGDDYEAIGKYVAQAIDNHTTISDPDNPGYVIVLSTAQQEQGKKDRAEMLAKTIANEAKKGTFNVSDEELEPIIKVMAHNVDADYQKEFAKKIKDAKYESTKVDISVNADEFYKYMANANFSKEQAIDILMQRFEKTLGIDDVGYNYEVYNFKRDKVREYYEAHYDSMIGTKATAKQWGDFKDKANDYANKLVKSTFGKSVSKVDPSEFDTPSINPNFGLTENATPSTTYVVPPATTGTTTAAQATTTGTPATTSTDTKPKSQKFVIPPAPGSAPTKGVLTNSWEEIQAINEARGDNYDLGTGPISQEEYEDEYRIKGFEAPHTGDVRSLVRTSMDNEAVWEAASEALQELPHNYEAMNGYEDVAFDIAQEYYTAWLENPDYYGQSFEDWLAQNPDRTDTYPRTYTGTGQKATRREALNYSIAQAVGGTTYAKNMPNRGGFWANLVRR